jgi:hypothetical protein
MYARAEHLGFRQNTDTPNTINLHFHIWVAIGVAEVCQMWAPGGILCITFDNDSILIKGVCKREGSFRFLPRVQIVRLLSSKPVGKWSPDICVMLVEMSPGR